MIDFLFDGGTNIGLTAYIGPGAGIALMGSFFAIIISMIISMAVIATWPARYIWRAVRGRKALVRAKVRRVVILGLDGLEPSLTEKFLDEGILPNLAKLKEFGTYRRLGTTCPPLSPVAWSSFTTGTNPGKHNIFDFISRDPSSYQPTMSSVRIRQPRRTIRLGKYVIPLSRPEITGLRKSKPFWTVLGEANIFSAVLRVPITFPPDRFAGVQLSAMCVPDLLGTQGTFSYYTDHGTAGTASTTGGGGGGGDADIGGRQIVVERRAKCVHSFLEGPENSLRVDSPPLRIPFTVRPSRDGASAVMTIHGQRVPLAIDEFTDWVRVSFSAAPGIKVRGICKFLLRKFDSAFEMYASSVQIDPDKPVMPIAHPTVYSSYLARQQESFATLGLAEDTWSLSEGLMTEDGFLQQAYDIQAERETMFFDALNRVRSGMVVCVFDAPDRIQHMFWRFLEDDHPALEGKENTHREAIRDMYVRMDRLVGKTMDMLDDDCALLVMSDHGFNSFRRGVDLNAWLLEQGYLVLKDEATSSDRQYLGDVDWSRTRAYAMGLAGFFVNQKGREAQGIVAAGAETKELVAEIVGKLTGLCDPQDGTVAIHEAIPREKAYQGPYVETAPDIIVGYNKGYRVSWDSAVGKTGGEVFSDNKKAWSGDHCIHPDLMPGVLFTNLKLGEGEANIIDIGPTSLELLGVETPAYMDGRSLL